MDRALCRRDIPKGPQPDFSVPIPSGILRTNLCGWRVGLSDGTLAVVPLGGDWSQKTAARWRKTALIRYAHLCSGGGQACGCGDHSARSAFLGVHVRCPPRWGADRHGSEDWGLAQLSEGVLDGRQHEDLL